MKLADYKLVFVAAGLIGVLLLASPTLGLVVRFPQGEKFSELYVLGPERMAENYPFNVVEGRDYEVYVGVGNHVGSSAYYVGYVKFRNLSEPLPNSTLGTPSPLSPLLGFRVLLQDGGSWEESLRFSFSNMSFSGERVTVGTVRLNGVEFVVDKESVWDAENNGFFYQLFVELWIYNPALETREFNNRFVGLQVNMTGSP